MGLFVGIPACARLRNGLAWHETPARYAIAVEGGVGAVPLMIPPAGEGQLAALDVLNGLLVPGSPSNVHPDLYAGGASLTPELHDPARDATALPLIRAAIARGMPILAICRGIQELNVALGGTLHQQLHDLAGRLDHRGGEGPLEARYGPKHPVRICGSLARMLGTDVLTVNSLHGQAIDRLAPGLVVEAEAPDGTIEAVRVSSASGFAYGVQWHPEWRFSENPASVALFHAFGDACRAYQQSCERQHAMDLKLAGKHALITGGSKGIGRAAALVLAEEGCDVTLVARDPSVLQTTAATIRARRQVKVDTIAADLSTDAAVRGVAERVGEVDVLVNNAGAIPPGDILAVDDAIWRRAWDLKVFGFISLCRAIFPRMASRKSGVIVNVIGAAGEKFPYGYIAGAAGNAALMAFTRALGRQAPADGLRVIGINPGPVATERLVMLQQNRAAQTLGDAGRWQELFATMPFGRAASPEEIGYAVAFLASPLSAYTSGTILTIDGGAG